MNKIQRAFITTLVYAFKNNKIGDTTRSNTVGVECLSGARTVIFKGVWGKNKIDVYEKEFGTSFKSIEVYPNAYEVTIRCGRPVNDTIKLEIPLDSAKYNGKSDRDYFEGYYTPADRKVQIEDSGGKSARYTYKIRW